LRVYNIIRIKHKAAVLSRLRDDISDNTRCSQY